MKIHRVTTDNKRLTHRDSLLMNIYYFCCIYRYLFFLLIGFVGVIGGVLFLADKIAHKELNELDVRTTMLLFDNLQQSNRHHEAILLMEYKGAIMNTAAIEIDYKTKLADSYMFVGDYAKAEKMLLDVEQRIPQYIKKYTDIPSYQFDLLYFGIYRTIYQLYEQMGDSNNQAIYYYKYRAIYDAHQQVIDSIAVATYNARNPHSKKSAINIKETVEYDSLVVTGFHDRENGIKGLSLFVDKIIDRKEYSAAFKVKCLNKLIGMLLAEEELAEAYPRIKQAVEQTKTMNIAEYEQLGELSDYCYAIHDIAVSKALFKRYKQYLGRAFRKDDLSYIKGCSRELRYLEQEEEWDKLSKKIVEYCEGMRQQISINIPSMTEEQREMFVKQFDDAYHYAFRVLTAQPSPSLAALCFDNITFRDGLLLRSNSALRQRILSSNDSTIIKQYETLTTLRREQIYEAVAHKGLFSREKEIGRDIAAIEKDLALRCVDFKQKNNSIACRYRDIQRYLPAEASVVVFVENDDALFALVLQAKGEVEYIPIGPREELATTLSKSIDEIYSDTTLTHFLWGKVAEKVQNSNTIYYLPVGLFQQMAMGVLRYDEEHYLCDMKTWRLLSNPTMVMEDTPDIDLSTNEHTVALWGGIDYGTHAAQTYLSPDNDGTHSRRVTKRGTALGNLRYSYEEVENIAQQLRANDIPTVVFTGSAATKKTFQRRSGSDDYIVHLSTHGFFEDSPSIDDAMLRSGLFFAGANRYWCNDTIAPPAADDDGILRAADVATLDLSPCALAVLSACETGLGYNDVSEGVYGLQRAFKIAGVDLLLMSLWDVDDRATSLLMSTFYSLLLQGDNAEAALRKSQQVVRQMYPSPEAWGAFVLLY